MIPTSETYWINTRNYTKKHWWNKSIPSDFVINWSHYGKLTHYETYDEAVTAMHKKAEEYDVRRYKCDVNKDMGRLIIEDQPLPTPYTSYRIGILTVPNKEDHLHYTVEKLVAKKGWVVLYKDTDRRVMEEEMKEQARSDKYDGDDHGIAIDGFEDYEIICIYNDGTSLYQEYRTNNRLCGIHVVNYYE